MTSIASVKVREVSLGAVRPLMSRLRDQMVKDFWQARWIIAFTAAMVVVGTVASIAATYLGSAGAIVQLLVLLVIMLLAVSLVQNDSPSRTDAYWKTLPVSGTVVLLSKFLLLSTVTFPLVMTGQLLSLQFHNVPFFDGLFYSLPYLGKLLPAMLPVMYLAAVTPNLKGFIGVSLPG